ncbi:MAG: PAS domain S-box protein, partial [Nitrococcus sp.]|nr:PAS domain S-box protein [Nitrococcus sp.]
ITCRNLLIYLEPSLQKKAIPTFHYALKPGRFLWLGASESIGGCTDLFEPLDKKHKIYVKKAAPVPAFHLPLRKEHGERGLPPLPTVRSEPAEGLRGELNAQREADRVVVNRYTPPGVLVNDELQVLQFRGATSRYLAPPSGKASFDVLKMARKGLMLPLREAINEARKGDQAARRNNVRVNQNGAMRAVSVEVIPLKNLRERCFLVLFEEAQGERRPAEPTPAAAERLPRDEATERIADLETELTETRDYLQSMQEQHEAANEELHAANEEAQSSNEELQSINEELETSKEELESSNEELATVNEEMANRNAELNRLNDDLVNLQNSTELAILLLGRNLSIKRFSAQAEEQFQLRASDLDRPIGHVRHNLALVPEAGEESAPDLEEIIDQVIVKVRGAVREARDKTGRWYSLRVRPYLTLDNKVDGAVLVLVDVTALKRAEEASRESERRFREMIDALPAAIYTTDAEGRLTHFNPAAVELSGRTPQLGTDQWCVSWKLYHADGTPMPHDECPMAIALKENDAIRGEEIITERPNGTRRWIMPYPVPLREPDGQMVGGINMLVDITERKRAERMNVKLAAIVASSEDAIISKDLEGIIQTWNAGAQHIFGYTAEEAIGQPVTMLIPPEHGDEESDILAHIRRGEPIEHYETVRRCKDGTLKDVALTISPVLDERGRVAGASKIAHDITERKRLEWQIQEQTEELAAADRRKDEFLAMLSHELRNPLAPMLNALQLIGQEQGERARQHEAYSIIERQVRHMARLVEDLLDVSRITTGRIRLRIERLDANSVIDHAVERLRPAIDRRGQQLSISPPTSEPVWLDADRDRLEQVVGNLLDNASKYSDLGGHIALSIERGDGQAIIRVRDDGDGMATDTLAHIFELFTQANQSLGRSQGGLGIGLALVKSLVELHGGRIEAHSDGLGQGSEFIVRLPLAASQTRPPDTTATRDTATGSNARLRILIVDDNADAAKMASMLLRTWGHEVCVADDGAGALREAAEFHPQVILLDIGLPDMDGYEVARLIRKELQLKDMRIVAVTGYAQDSDRQRARQAGFDHHLTKPVEPSALKALLVGFLQEEADTGSRAGDK